MEVPDGGSSRHQLDTLVIGGGVCGVELLDRIDGLDLLVRAGTGLDLVDLDAAGERGITVTNTPGYATDEVADHALLLLLASVRRLHHFERAAQDNWFAVRPEGVPRLAGRTLRLVGLGRIGRAMARRGRALGMPVIACDPGVDEATFRRADAEQVSWATLLNESDVISLHLPLTPTTHRIVDAAALTAMRPSAALINTASGALVDHDALLDALDSGHLAAAGLDVVEDEPRPPRRLLTHDRIVVTPHVGWYSEGARTAMGEIAARTVLAGPSAVSAQVHDLPLTSRGTDA
ncbi:NAD(P)-dependent oxidoreductase [Propionibacteriaceae bacterium Y1685]